MNAFAIQFTLIKQDDGDFDITVNRFVENPRDDGPDIRDVLNPYEVKLNIECDMEIEALKPGVYDCFLAGKWDYDGTYDAEGGYDATLEFSDTLLEIGPWRETE